MSMSSGLAVLNRDRKPKVASWRNDDDAGRFYYSGMSEWYIREWAATLGKRPVDFVRDLEWNKSRVSLLFSGKQPYSPAVLRDVAAYLNLQPFELLMHPDRAMAYRRMTASAATIAADAGSATEAPDARVVKLRQAG